MSQAATHIRAHTETTAQAHEKVSKQRYRIQVINRDREYFCDAETSLLLAMEQDCANAINVGCRGGGCGVCKIRVVTGNYQTKKMSKAHICDQDAADGFALACRTFPSSDMTIESDQFALAKKVAISPEQTAEIPNIQANNKDNAEDK